jgi:site-specific DNA-cytosine methylase
MNQVIEKEIKHFHLFCGSGGGAKGFNNGRAEVNGLRAKFRCIGGIDVDPAAIKDFDQLSGVKGTVLDLFDRKQYESFHGEEPPKDWSQAGPEQIRKAAGNERPNIVFLSAPCKGFSGLLSESRSKTDKYQALNRLTLRGVWLMLEAWGDDPPELVIFENVPRIGTRGRPLINQISQLLRSYGYAVAETTHDCGEIGGLAQSRKRFLLVARHTEKVQPFLYEPIKKNLRGVGEVIGRLPVPGSGQGGPMHRIPELQWKTWVRLAFVEAGSDWRSLNKLAVADGWLKDFLIVPEHQNGYMGVNDWNGPIGTVAGASRPGNGAFSVADPRIEGIRHNNVFRVVRYGDHSPSITGGIGPSSGGLGVADPRTRENFSGYGVKKWSEVSATVAGESFPSNGTFSVADPRTGWAETAHTNKFAVQEWTEPASTVIGTNRGPGSGAGCVADPRLWNSREKFESGGHYGVIPWNEPSGAISAKGKHDNGRFNVADPRPLPESTDQLVARIISADGTWHRPFTTLELAALQGLIDPEEQIILDGLSDSAWRERIGNAVPPAAAEAIAGVMGQTLLLSWSGQTFHLGSTPIWVRQVAVGMELAR